MISREFRDFLSKIHGERIFNRDQRICVLTRRSFERGVDIGGLPYFHRLKLDLKGSARARRLLEYQRRIGIGCIPEDGHARNSG